MDPASFAFSIFTSVETCIKLFEFLSCRFRAYKDAASEIEETLDILDHYGFKIETQLQLLQSEWDSFDPEYKSIQMALLERLKTRLQSTAEELERVNPGTWLSDVSLRLLRPNQVQANQLRYAMQVQSALKNLIAEVERWANLFDPSWFLLARSFERMRRLQSKLRSQSEEAQSHKTALQAITAQTEATEPAQTETSTRVFLPSIELVTTNIIRSSAKEVHQPSRGLILDAGQLESSETTINDVRMLARALQKVDPSISGLLQCKGVMKRRGQSRTLAFDFVFRIPAGLTRPRGLRDILLKSERHPLNERLQLAKSLARAVAFLHNIRVVHKNISADTCITLQRSPSLGEPFLVGFSRFRLAETQTMLVGDDDWVRNIYRHPLRQGIFPLDRHIMQHDVYSLGVLLLEIGLWTSFVTEIGEPSQIMEEVNSIVNDDRHAKATLLKDFFTHLATEELPTKMGAKYKNVVLAYLTCLNEENNHFGLEEDFEDKDGIVVGVRYIEKVLMQLDEITL